MCYAPYIHPSHDLILELLQTFWNEPSEDLDLHEHLPKLKRRFSGRKKNYQEVSYLIYSVNGGYSVLTE